MSLNERKNLAFKMVKNSSQTYVCVHGIAVFYLGNSAKMQQAQENEFDVGTPAMRPQISRK